MSSIKRWNVVVGSEQRFPVPIVTFAATAGVGKVIKGTAKITGKAIESSSKVITNKKRDELKNNTNTNQ
jgi:hypothetical protein